MNKHRALFTILLTCLALLLSACAGPFYASGSGVVGSGKYSTRTYAIDGFTGIQADSGFQVTLTGGDTYKVAVTADDNLFEVIEVRKEASTLVFGFKPGSVRSTKLDAAVTLPSLESVRLNGGSALIIAGNAPQSGNLVVNGNGGSRADLRAVAADKVSVTLNGGAQATVNAKRIDYDLNGGAQLRYTGNPTIGTAKIDGGAQASGF